MAKKEEYLEDILNTRDFYEFYRKVRKKPSPKIDQYNYFKKAMSGFIKEIRDQLDKTEHGIHFKGFGVLYKKPFGNWFRRLSLFTHRTLQRGLTFFYLEDEYLRNKYIIILFVWILLWLLLLRLIYRRCRCRHRQKPNFIL